MTHPSTASPISLTHFLLRDSCVKAILNTIEIPSLHIAQENNNQEITHNMPGVILPFNETVGNTIPPDTPHVS